MHIQDYVKDKSLNQALLLVESVFLRWNKLQVSPILVALVIQGEPDDAVVKFHVRRSKERWLGPAIEGYTEAVREIDSQDVPSVRALCAQRLTKRANGAKDRSKDDAP
jgi:hypothetical protein